MALSRTSRLAFLSEDGQQIEAPLEWTKALVSIDCEVGEWRQPRLTCNAQPIPLYVCRLDERDRVLGRWLRSGAGHYELQLTWDDGSWEESRICTVEPSKLDSSAVTTMLDDLNRRLPASIAIALRRGGALSGIAVVPPAERTLAGEVHRLSRAVDGTEVRAGLVQVLQALSGRPHRVLRPKEHWVGRHQVRRVDPARFLQAFGQASNLSSDGLPMTVPERPVAHSADIYENRLVKAFHEQVDVRLRMVIRALEKRGDREILQEAAEALARLASARRQAAFLDEVSPLSEPPSRVSMLLLRRAEYRAAMEGFIEFRRSAIVHLREPAIEAPLENLPFLYQSWGVLEVLSVALGIAVDLGYDVISERLAVRAEGEIWIRLLRDGRPVAELAHAGSGARVRVTPQRRYPVGGDPLGSISFEQIPDVVVEVECDGDVAVYVFDPKYKLRGEDDGRSTSRPKKEDVDAMHAYRDAIRDPQGERVVQHAALLYPGQTRHYGQGLSALRAHPGAHEGLRREVRSVLEVAMSASAQEKR
ncbi:MAG TPA: DUF2357 domain-containing protein [Solirubrobacterales bacterium]